MKKRLVLKQIGGKFAERSTMDFSTIVVKKRNKTVAGKNYVYYEARSTIKLETGSSFRATGSGKTANSLI